MRRAKPELRYNHIMKNKANAIAIKGIKIFFLSAIMFAVITAPTAIFGLSTWLMVAVGAVGCGAGVGIINILFNRYPSCRYF